MFQMIIDDMFIVGSKTIFSGILETELAAIPRTICTVYVDGVVVGEILIEGEVLNGTGRRDLWTKSTMNLDKALISIHDVRLIA